MADHASQRPAAASIHPGPAQPGALARVSAASWRPSRRQLLKTGALTAVGLWGVSVTGTWLWAAEEEKKGKAKLAFFRGQDLPLMRAVVGAYLDGILPPGSDALRKDTIDRTIASADRYFSSYTPAIQAEALQAFDLLGLAPVRWLGGLWSSWESASTADMNRYLEGLRTGRFALSRQIFRLVTGLAVVGWYSQPASWAAIGYPGPPNPPRPLGERPL